MAFTRETWKMSTMVQWKYVVCPSCTSAISVPMYHCPYCGMFMDVHQLQVILKDAFEESRDRMFPRLSTRASGIKNPSLAILLSILLPGSGQIYLGYVSRGIIILISTLFLLIFTIGLALWILNILDVLLLARQHDK